MALQTRSITTLKQQIYGLIEQLPGLLRFIEQWLENNHPPEPNGATVQPSSISGEAVEADQPWLKYTAKLKASPHWDEFLEAMADTRQTTDKTETSG